MDIQEGDRVQYEHGKKEYGNASMEHGTVGRINGDFMGIKVDGYEGILIMSARRINGKWFAFCSYDEDYVKEVSKA
jgi:hypothetical protein